MGDGGTQAVVEVAHLVVNDPACADVEVFRTLGVDRCPIQGRQEVLIGDEIGEAHDRDEEFHSICGACPIARREIIEASEAATAGDQTTS